MTVLRYRHRLLAAGALAAAMFLTGTAAAASPPAVTTGAATAVGATSASISGMVNPNGEATTWYVEYGTSTSYGSKTSSQSAGSGTSNVSVSTTLSNLTSGTTYHYRVVATSSAGTTLGTDATFATASAPVVATGSASDVTVNSATLNGTLNPNGRGTTWYFEYGTSTSYGTKTAVHDAGSGTSTVSESASVSSLKASTLYHFRLVATSDAGTTHGADQTFFTATAAPLVTTSPATSVTAGGARLNGSVNPNGHSTTAFFEYGTTTSYGSRTGNRNAGSGTSTRNVTASISGLRAGTTYHFRLVATSAAGTTAGSDETFTTTGVPVVQTGPVQNIGTTTTTLTGTVNPSGRTTTWYFEYGTTGSYGTRTAAGNAGAGTSAVSVSFTVSNLAAGTTYHYRLVAANSAGTRSGADASFTTARPTVTLAAGGLKVVYGRRVKLSGTVSSGQSGESVTVLAQPYGQGSFTAVATASTAAGGTWSYLAKPGIQTSYEATWNGTTSTPVTVGVRPSISLHVLGNGRFSTHVGAARSAAGRVVKLQRRSLDRWVTLIQKRLDRSSRAVFQTNLPPGTSTLRVAMSVNQAGSGYLAGFSRTVVYQR